ncbi:hypothetical protein M0R45_009948 [Rubus argutus]|uniref:Uncharacterized protein n=1 Tax=Rubus argutus TaxID=59490 RepID=A0AAW1Y6K4_RUBAR
MTALLEKRSYSNKYKKLSQLEWHCSAGDDEIRKLTTDRKVLQDHLHDAVTQLSQLVVKEKNALAERLKGAEAARKRFDEELKRYATEKATREEGKKREKEELVGWCETYIDGIKTAGLPGFCLSIAYAFSFFLLSMANMIIIVPFVYMLLVHSPGAASSGALFNFL